MERFLGSPLGPLALLVLGVVLVVCGGSACWCRFKRSRGGAGCENAPRRW